MPKRSLWTSPLTTTLADRERVTLPESLIGYLIGPFGALLSSGIFTSFLNTYFTDVLKLETGFLTTLQLVSTLLIVLSNLAAGQLIERTHALAGKARPWILLSALTLSTASLLMFVVPFGGTARMVWIAVAYNLYYAVAYPIYNTANATLIPVSTRDTKQRGKLASMTNMAGLGVMGAGSMVFPILVSQYMHEDQTRWFTVMLGVALFSALTIYLQFRFTRERVTEEDLFRRREGAANAAPTLGRQLNAATGVGWWWLILAFYLLFQWSGAIKNGSMYYFCRWVLGSSELDWGYAQTLLSVLGAIPMAVAAVFVVPLSNRWGKRAVVLGGLIVGVIGGVIEGLGGDHLLPVAVGVAVKCLGSAPACYLILAMLADVIDHIEYRFGLRTDGLTMSIYSSLMVAATPIMNAAFMAMLGASGYVPPTEETALSMVQSAAARSTMTVSFVWIETAAYALCAVLMWFFTVEKRLPQEQAELAARKKGG